MVGLGVPGSYLRQVFCFFLYIPRPVVRLGDFEKESGRRITPFHTFKQTDLPRFKKLRRNI